MPIARNRSEMPLLGKGLVYRIGYKLPQVNIEMTNNLIIFRPAKDLIRHCTEDDNQITNIYVKRYETAKETLMYGTVLWTLWERERVGRFGRMTLKHVKYHVRNKLPVQV